MQVGAQDEKEITVRPIMVDAVQQHVKVHVSPQHVCVRALSHACTPHVPASISAWLGNSITQTPLCFAHMRPHALMIYANHSHKYAFSIHADRQLYTPAVCREITLAHTHFPCMQTDMHTRRHSDVTCDGAQLPRRTPTRTYQTRR